MKENGMYNKIANFLFIENSHKSEFIFQAEIIKFDAFEEIQKKLNLNQIPPTLCRNAGHTWVIGGKQTMFEK